MHWIGDTLSGDPTWYKAKTELSSDTFHLTFREESAATARTASHYDDVIMSLMASQITRHTIVYSTVYSDADQREHQSSAWLAFVWGIHRGPVNSPHKWPVTRKMYPFDDVIMHNKLMMRTLIGMDITITSGWGWECCVTAFHGRNYVTPAVASMIRRRHLVSPTLFTQQIYHAGCTIHDFTTSWKVIWGEYDKCSKTPQELRK